MSDNGPEPAPPRLATAAIEAIPTLPVFLKLRGRRVVLAGGSPPAVWKAELLAAAGARVVVFDPAPCGEMLDLNQKLGNVLHIVKRGFGVDDLAGAAVVVGALEGAEAKALRVAANKAGVPLNVIDVPELCDFQFGTVVARPPLLIAISTDGAAPVFGQALRARIEALLPEHTAAWAQAAKAWRPAVQERHFSFAARRRFWEAFADRALSGVSVPPTEDDRQHCLEAAEAAEVANPGSVDLVGLGPGEPDLLTLRAVRALQSAEVVVHEAGLHPALVGLARREAKRVIEDIDARVTATWIASWVEEGKRVVWAALGSPASCPAWLVRQSAYKGELREVAAGLPCAACRDLCSSGVGLSRPDQ